MRKGSKMKRSMKLAAVIAGLLAGMILTACAAKAPQENAEITEPESASVTAPWFELSGEGEVLTVRLDSNPTTGYSWNYKISDEEILEHLTDELVLPEAKEGFAGAGGTWCASFKPSFQKDGDVTLTLNYARPWESQPIFIKTLSLSVKEKKITVNDFSEMEKNPTMLADGEYEAELNADSMNKDGDVITAELTEKKPVILTDEEVKALKVGDTIDLSAYALSPMNVTKTEKLNENAMEINDYATLKKDGNLGGWKIAVENDDLISYPVSLGQATFDQNTVFNDELSKIAYGDANRFRDIYDCVQNYQWVNAVITMKGGHADEVKVLYHP